MKKILGIGNALVDVLICIDDETIFQEFNLPKGGMQLVDKEIYNKIIAKCSSKIVEIATGGSAANTLSGIANLGLDCGFIGKIGKDKFGKLLSDDINDCGISPKLMYSKNETGLAITFVTLDSERTFAVYLGAAVELFPEDICNEDFVGYDYFHIEGYLVQNHDLMRKALRLAKDNGLKISLDLASFDVVQSDKPFLKEIVKTYVDIIFANEEEAKAYTGKNPKEALDILANECEIAIVKIGSKGSMIKAGDDRFDIGVIEANPIDTTGAGDLYASGFLHGLAVGKSLEYCGKLGSILSGNVIETLGAKMDKTRWEKIYMEIAGI